MRGRTRALPAAVLGAVWLAVGAIAAAAHAPIGTVDYSLATGSAPRDVATGPDGSVWFTESGSASIGRLSPDGSQHSYPVPKIRSGTPQPIGIVVGADGAIWFSEQNYGDGNANGIGRLVPGTGHIDQYPTTVGTDPLGITLGPDGNIWFTEDNAAAGSSTGIGRVTPGGTVSEFEIPSDARPSGYNEYSRPTDIVADPTRRSLWFTERNWGNVGEVVLDGADEPTITHPAALQRNPRNSGPAGIAAGPDGAIWVTEHWSSRIFRFDPSTLAVTTWDTPTDQAEPRRITAGVDGDLWVSEGAGYVARITTSGSIMEWPLAGAPASDGDPNTFSDWAAGIRPGPDGQLWFALQQSNTIAEVSMGSDVPAGPPTVSGNATAGSTLTCAPAVWPGATAASGVQWLRDGTPVGGAIGPLLKTTAADVGHALSCRESVRFPGVLVGYAGVSSAMAIKAAPGQPAPPPVVPAKPPVKAPTKLRIVLARTSIVTVRGRRVSVRFTSTVAGTATLTLATRKGFVRLRLVRAMRAGANAIVWNGRLHGRLPRVGVYRLTLRATASAHRIAGLAAVFRIRGS